MPKHADTDLLPWILGGFLVAAGAIATVIPATVPVDTRASSEATLANPVSPARPPPIPVASTQVPALVQPSAQVRPALPPGQVWQCVVNGQQTFSDSPCGANSSIRQLGELNRMDPTPVPPAWAYRSSDAGYAPAPADQDTADPASDVYTSEQVNVINERTRRGHMSRIHHHDHGAARRS
jgi:hypothetical protein